MIFDTKPQLLRALVMLSTNNEKEIAWSRHAPEQFEAERGTMLVKIKGFVARVGQASLPPEFTRGMRSGAVAVDGAGQFQAAVRMHVNG